MFTKDALVITGISALVLVLAFTVGNLIYKKMSKKVFLNLTYILMIISGISLLLK